MLLSYLITLNVFFISSGWASDPIPGVGSCADKVNAVLGLIGVNARDRNDRDSPRKTYRFKRKGQCDFAKVVVSDDGTIEVKKISLGLGCEARRDLAIANKKYKNKDLTEAEFRRLVAPFQGDANLTGMQDNPVETLSFVFNPKVNDCEMSAFRSSGVNITPELCLKIQGYESTWKQLDPVQKQNMFSMLGIPESIENPVFDNCGFKNRLAYQFSVDAILRAKTRNVSVSGLPSVAPKGKDSGTRSGTRVN